MASDFVFHYTKYNVENKEQEGLKKEINDNLFLKCEINYILFVSL